MISRLVIGGNVSIIPKESFFEYENLHSVEFGDSVAEIGASAFEECTKLQYIKFSESSKLKLIGSFSFRNCNELKDFTVPNTVLSIGDYTFSCCNSLIFLNCQIQWIKFARQSSFERCVKLIYFVLGDVKLIGNFAFYSCISLKKYINSQQSQKKSVMISFAIVENLNQ